MPTKREKVSQMHYKKTIRLLLLCQNKSQSTLRLRPYYPGFHPCGGARAAAAPPSGALVSLHAPVTSERVVVQTTNITHVNN